MLFAFTECVDTPKGIKIGHNLKTLGIVLRPLRHCLIKFNFPVLLVCTLDLTVNTQTFFLGGGGSVFLLGCTVAIAVTVMCEFSETVLDQFSFPRHHIFSSLNLSVILAVFCSIHMENG